MIARRAFVTGLAAVAGAGFAPALPARAAPLQVVTRHLRTQLKELAYSGRLLQSTRPANPKYQEYPADIIRSANYLHKSLVTDGAPAYFSDRFGCGAAFGAITGFATIMSAEMFGPMTDEQLRYANIIEKDGDALWRYHGAIFAKLKAAARPGQVVFDEVALCAALS